jgi:hypothetical protein
VCRGFKSSYSTIKLFHEGWGFVVVLGEGVLAAFGGVVGGRVVGDDFGEGGGEFGLHGEEGWWWWEEEGGWGFDGVGGFGVDGFGKLRGGFGGFVVGFAGEVAASAAAAAIAAFPVGAGLFGGGLFLFGGLFVSFATGRRVVGAGGALGGGVFEDHAGLSKLQDLVVADGYEEAFWFFEGAEEE